MELYFGANEILARGKGLTFDDVLLIPRHSEISSRRDPELISRLTQKYDLELPVVSSNMDTITEASMAISMSKLGGIGILHRFMPIQSQKMMVAEIKAFQEKNDVKTPIAASIGVKQEGIERAHQLVDAGVDILTIDIAHGDSIMMFETLDYMKKHFPQVEIIAGNVASQEGVKRLIDHGANAIKVGIGPGSMCTTRIITGCGVPQLTAVALCSEVAKKHDIPIIADGGIKNSGDIVKALSAGADTVMLGSMLSGCLETPGEVKGGRKRYRGMASKDAQVSWRGELPRGMAAEGEATWVNCKGSVENVVGELAGGLRSGMSYLNAGKIAEMRTKALFMEMTTKGIEESRPHGLQSHPI